MNHVLQRQRAYIPQESPPAKGIAATASDAFPRPRHHGPPPPAPPCVSDKKYPATDGRNNARTDGEGGPPTTMGTTLPPAGVRPVRSFLPEISRTEFNGGNGL